MSAGTVPNRRAPLVSDTILTRIGAAMMAYRVRTQCSQQTLAELLGREDRKSVASWENGTTELGAVPLLRSLQVLDKPYRAEVLAIVGVEPHDLEAEAGDPFDLADGVSELLAAIVRRLRDGKLCHNDKLFLAGILEPLLPELNAIVDEARALRS
jgi:transcriptional regulator with XRE-family HTH domain